MRLRRLAGLIAWIAAAASSGPSPVHPGFFRASQGAAANALGGSFAAKADDASALFINPAGLAQLARSEAYLLYDRPLAGLSGVSLQQGHAAVAAPLGGRWTLGAGASVFDAGGLLREYEALLGAAYRIGAADLGASLSYLTHTYRVGGDGLAAPDPVFQGGSSKSGLGLSLGALLRAGPAALGLSVRHLNRPDLGLASPDPVPREVRAGALYRWGRASLIGEVGHRDARSGAEGEARTGFGGGLEVEAYGDPDFGAVTLRAGGGPRRATAGFSLSMGGVIVDYAFTLMSLLIEDNAGSHTLGLRLRFGEARGRPESWSRRVYGKETGNLWRSHENSWLAR